MPTNNFKPFSTAGGANVITQAEYEALAALSTGWTSGKASSKEVNKAVRQATFIAAAVAQFVADRSGLDVLDDGNVASFVTKLITAMSKTSQPLDATLTALAGLVGAANKLAYFNGTDTAALTDLTSVGRDLIGKADTAAVLAYLGIKPSSLIDVGESIGDAKDLDTYSLPGFFYQSQNSQAASGKNYPSPYAGSLAVYKSSGVTQVYRVYSTSRSFSRSLSAGVWSAWAQDYDSVNTVPDATTSSKGITQLSSATNSTSEAQAATPKAVKAANDNANGRVPSTRTINSYALSADFSISSQDIFNDQPLEIGALGDLNSMTTAGLYFQPSNTNASLSRNYPEAQAGALMVLKTTGCIQIYFIYGSSRRYSRGYYNGAFTPWYMDYNAGNLPDSTLTAKGVVQLANGPGSSSTLVMSQTAVTALNNTNIGKNQAVTDVTASRALGVTYTNTTGNPIAVSVAITGGLALTLTATVSGVRFAYDSSTAEKTAGNGVFFIVPAGATYSVAASQSPGVLLFWTELR